MTALIGPAMGVYNKMSSFSDTDAVKQKIIQVAASVILTNAIYSLYQARATQATINVSGAFVLWMNKDAFLHKALSENVQSFNVENDRLSAMVNKFEEIGVNLSKLSEGERVLLKMNMEKSHNIFNAMIQTAAQSARKLDTSVEKQTSDLTQACSALLQTSLQAIRVLKSVKSDSDLPALNISILMLTEMTQRAVKQITT